MNKVYDIITNQILDKLKAGVVPWRKPWTAGVPKNAITKKTYRGFNIWRLGSEGYNNPHWASFKQVQKLGGSVIKKQHATMIIYWKLLEFEDKKSGEEKKVPMLRYHNMFNIEQTTLCDDERFEIVKNDNDPIEACESIINNYKNGPEITHADSARAFFEHNADIINMPDIGLFDTSEDYYSTLFHEATHSTGHHTRLKRREPGEKRTMKDPKYWFEEIIAELGAAMLGGETGIDFFTLDNSASYIDGYIKALENDPKVFIQAASAAQKAVEYIKGVEAA